MQNESLYNILIIILYYTIFFHSRPHTVPFVVIYNMMYILYKIPMGNHWRLHKTFFFFLKISTRYIIFVYNYIEYMNYTVVYRTRVSFHSFPWDSQHTIVWLDASTTTTKTTTNIKKKKKNTIKKYRNNYIIYALLAYLSEEMSEQINKFCNDIYIHTCLIMVGMSVYTNSNPRVSLYFLFSVNSYVIRFFFINV